MHYSAVRPLMLGAYKYPDLYKIGYNMCIESHSYVSSYNYKEQCGSL